MSRIFFLVLFIHFLLSEEYSSVRKKEKKGQKNTTLNRFTPLRYQGVSCRNLQKLKVRRDIKLVHRIVYCLCCLVLCVFFVEFCAFSLGALTNNLGLLMLWHLPSQVKISFYGTFKTSFVDQSAKHKKTKSTEQSIKKNMYTVK